MHKNTDEPVKKKFVVNTYAASFIYEPYIPTQAGPVCGYLTNVIMWSTES